MFFNLKRMQFYFVVEKSCIRKKKGGGGLFLPSKDNQGAFDFREQKIEVSGKKLKERKRILLFAWNR